MGFGYDLGVSAAESQSNSKYSATEPLLHPNTIPSKKTH